MVADFNKNNDYQNLLATIGKNIAKYRKEVGLSQHELAAQIGFADKSLSNIERGAAGLTISTLFAISQTLNVAFPLLFQDDEIIISRSEIVKAIMANALKTNIEVTVHA